MLDGIIAPNFDRSENKRRMEALHEAVSSTMDQMAQRREHSYRKSDDA